MERLQNHEDILSELNINPVVNKIKNYRNKCVQNFRQMDRDWQTVRLIKKYQPCGTRNQEQQKTSRVEMGSENVTRPETLHVVWWYADYVNSLTRR
jgi:hypothetical protein